jgi:hypothetical protein
MHPPTTEGDDTNAVSGTRHPQNVPTFPSKSENVKKSVAANTLKDFF